MAQAWVRSMISSGLLTSRASIINCWPSRTSNPCACNSRKTDVSAVSTPMGSAARPSPARTSRISATAAVSSPALGAMAPCKPVLPPREFRSSYSPGNWSRCALAAEPKSQIHGPPSRVTSAYRSPLLKAQ